MSDMPERIWAWVWDIPYPSRVQGKPEWAVTMYPAEQDVAEYVRADEIERLQEELREAREVIAQAEFDFDFVRSTYTEILGLPYYAKECMKPLSAFLAKSQ